MDTKLSEVKMSKENREEILSLVNKSKVTEEISKKIYTELDILDITDGIDGRSNLENLCDIVKQHKGQVGTENKVNSWTAWAIGLTQKKPDGEFLPLRRAFARAGFPDIDCDFEYFRRNEVYDYIIKKYGRENVANIGTYIGLKLRMCLIRVIKALDIAKAWNKGKNEYTSENMRKVEEILGQLPKPFGGKMRGQDENGKEKIIKTVEDAYKYCKDFKFYMDKHPDIMKHSKDIQGLLSSFSVHAAGVTLSSEPLHRVAPVRRARGDQFATQYVYEDLESMGLIKFDILAIASLTVIDRTVKMVKENYGIDIDIETLPMDDEKTFELYRSGKLKGVFQCENKGMQNTMKDIAVDSFNDISAAIALFRPGPMESIPEYCSRKRGMSAVSYFHPAIEKHVKKYLADTYGILVFQEQIMQICNALAGFSIAEGYIVIKGIGKKKEYLINKYKKKFIDGCQKNGIPENVADEYWTKFITPFASYGFNRAHSAAYGCLSYYTAYLKANYPVEFLVSSLNVINEEKKHDKLDDIIKDLKNFDIELSPKNLNSCHVNFVIVKKKEVESGIPKTIISPTLMVKGVGYNAAKEIEEKRPYKSFKDFAIKTSSKLVDRDSLASLIDAGFFDEYMKQHYRETKKRINKEGLLDKFAIIRKDADRAGRKGLGNVDLFEE
jgi:DNA polymerase III subunit alpha